MASMAVHGDPFVLAIVPTGPSTVPTPPSLTEMKEKEGNLKNLPQDRCLVGRVPSRKHRPTLRKIRKRNARQADCSDIQWSQRHGSPSVRTTPAPI